VSSSKLVPPMITGESGDRLPRRELGTTGLMVTPVAIGGGPIANAPEMFGHGVSAEQAIATVRRALGGPVNFLDTAARYGSGSVERVIGLVLGELGGVPEGWVVGTKADRDRLTDDFSGAQTRRSVLGSAARLGMDVLPLVLLHDPERTSFEEVMGPGGAVEMLQRLRDEGVIGHIGIAMGPVDLERRYLRTGIFEVLLTHNRYTLVDRSAEPLIQEACDMGIGVINAAVFGGGVLAKGPAVLPKYAYQAANGQLLRCVRQMETCCEQYGVPLKAAALQFSTRDVRVTSTIVGVSTPTRIDETVELLHLDIPEPLWRELEMLVPQRESWLN
jgi:D-threo-aldose 1-dehydrogenase